MPVPPSRVEDKGADPRWPGQLTGGLESLGLSLAAPQQEQLLAYLALLYKWNRAFNLTAVRDPAIAVSRQILDSLSVLPLVQGPRVLDLGSGGGLPGVPLAIARPEWELVLLDANGKKTRFLEQVRLELGLGNLQVVHGRAEQYRPEAPFSTVVSRAFAALPRLVEVSRHLLAPDGRWVAMKGRLPEEEIGQLPGSLRVRVEPLRVPGESATRHGVVVSKPCRGCPT